MWPGSEPCWTDACRNSELLLHESKTTRLLRSPPTTPAAPIILVTSRYPTPLTLPSPALLFPPRPPPPLSVLRLPAPAPPPPSCPPSCRLTDTLLHIGIHSRNTDSSHRLCLVCFGLLDSGLSQSLSDSGSCQLAAVLSSVPDSFCTQAPLRSWCSISAASADAMFNTLTL